MDQRSGDGRITIQDVARLAGVSSATVSKALNDAPHVSVESRRRVHAAVTKLGYRPNGIARSLKSRRSLTLGLITDDVEGVFTTAMVRGVEEGTSAGGFSVFLCNSYGDAARERAHLQVLMDQRVDGVILLSGYRVRERGAPALPLGNLPVVYLYQYTRDLAAPCIVPDDRGGADIGVRHLASLGRRRIAFVNGPHHYEATHLRLDGYRAALEAAGLAWDPALVRAGTWHEDSGYALTVELMALPTPPDAIFCASDGIAVGALDALRERGARVPDDVAVVGFDNRSFAAHKRPPLTTVALPFYEMGQLASKLLLDAISGRPPDPVLIRVPCTLVQRRSCGAAPLPP